MAASKLKSKFYDRLEVHERFRINLESIINKYDKPFEDSPILDLHKMSSVSDSLKDLSTFKPFGWTPLATDLQEGKKRKGGVSCDSALGSTLSPKSNQSSDEGSSANIYLQNYDFTHETSDSLGPFIRYKHLSMSKNPEIAGLKTDEGEYGESSDSDDDLRSVRSGPTYPQEKYAEKIKDNEIDVIEVDRTRQTENIPDGDICLDERPSQDRVRSWLSDDAFMNTSRHSNIDKDPKGDASTTEMEDVSQESEYTSTLSEDSLGDETKSLLEIKERFVRRVKSILVEGNNETDDISSSADETGGFFQRRADDRTEGKNNTFRTVNVRGSEIDRSSYPGGPSEAGGNTVRLPKGTLSSTICDEASTVRGIRNQDSSRDKPVMLSGDETTIIAGHFDDEIVSPERTDGGKAVTGVSTVKNGFELVHSPGGKIEWTSDHGRSKSAKKTLPFKTHQVQNKTELQDGKQPTTHLTPTKTKLASGLTEITFKTPQGKYNLPFKSRVSKTTSESPESSQGIMSEIMDFFRSPLPELLTSPMPILSPKGRLRTVQGKRVTRNSISKPDSTGRTCHSTVTIQESSSSKSNQSTSAMMFRQDVPTGSIISLDQSSHIMTSEETVIDIKSSKLLSDETLNTTKGPHCAQERHADTLNTTKGPHCVQERHAELHSIEHSWSTEEEGDISLLTEESSEESTTFQFQSISRITDEIPKTPTQPGHSTNILVKVPKTPTRLSIPANTLEIVSKTPSITSPFSRLRVDSAEKDHTKVRHVREKGMRDNLPHPSKSLVYSEGNLVDSRDSTENKPVMELLVYSSSDDEMEYKQEQKARRYRPKMRKGKDVSHSFGQTTSRQIDNNRIGSQVNSMEDKSGAQERLGSKCIGNDVIGSIEQCSNRCTEEARASVQAKNKITEFEQTYIVSNRERKTSIPYRMSPSRCQIDDDQKRWRNKTQSSSSSTIQLTFAETKEDECRSNELKHKSSTSHRIREDCSSLPERDGTRTACEGTSCTSPMMTNKDNRPSKRQNKEHGVTLHNKGSRLNRLKERNEETPKAKDRRSNLRDPQTNYQNFHTDRVSGGRDSTFKSNPEYNSNVHTRGGDGDGICVDNEDARSKVGSSDVLEDDIISTTPRGKCRLLYSTSSKFTTSDSANYEHSSDVKTKDEQRQRPFAQPAKLNVIPSGLDVRLNSPSVCNVRLNSPSGRDVIPSGRNVRLNSPSGRDVRLNSPSGHDVRLNSPRGRDVRLNSPSVHDVRLNSPSGRDVRLNSPSGHDVRLNFPSGRNVRLSSPSGRDVRLNSPSGSEVKLNSPRHQKILIQQEKLSTDRRAVRDVSFLSSTRIDEDISDSLISKDLNGTILSLSRLTRKEQPADEKQTKRLSGTHQGGVQENLSMMMDQTPSKRRRRGSDRANSLESPAKRRTHARRSSPRGSKALVRIKDCRRVVDSSDDSDIGMKEWNEESLSSSSLSLSSMCEGPGRCIKKICFKCAMNE